MILRSELRNRRSEAGSQMTEDGNLPGSRLSKRRMRFRNELPTANRQLLTVNRQLRTANCQLPIAYCLLILVFFTGCYSFNDISIPPEVKTVHIGFFENKARYVNPQLSPQLTDKLRQKINNQTRLTQVQGTDAHYDISGTITGYNVSTAAISQQEAATNRLTVTVKLVFRNNLNPDKNFEADVSRNFDFSANLSLQQAEQQLADEILRNMVDEIFNRIFSDW